MTPLTLSLLCATLSVEPVREVVSQLGLAGKSRSRDDLLATLSASPSTSMAVILDLLPRAELKALCRACGVDDSGKEKAPIVARLFGGDTQPATARTAKAEVKAAAESTVAKPAK